jgi:tight adherence protein C
MNYLAGAILGAGIFIIFFSFARRGSSKSETIQIRLQEYRALSLDEEELQKPFVERIIMPFFHRISAYLDSQTPQKHQQALMYKLIAAGRPGDLQPSDFMAVRYGATLLFFVLGLLVGLLIKTPLLIAIAAAFGAGLGYYLPLLWLNQKIDGRRGQIRRALPDALDLLTISVEAGLGFDVAMQRVTEKFRNALTDEFTNVLNEVRLGRPRMEALDEMGRRSGVEELHNFVQAVIQSEVMGVGIAKILRMQSDELRRRRRQKAQEKAAQASLKMMLPMVGCIFPTIWIILLGPSVMIIMKARG